MTDPEVTILLPVYNGEKYLKEAIDSILAQTYEGFELLIIDDNSTDRSREIIASFPDPRIRVIDNEQRTGLVKSLNQGIGLARGRYIARMDADDIALPDRLEKEVAFLDTHPGIGVVGGTVSLIDDARRNIGEISYPQTPGHIKWCMLFFNPMAHPSVMMRKEVLDRTGGYNENARYVEDYELWCRMAGITGLWNLKEALIYHRMHEGKVSSQHNFEQTSRTFEIIQGYIASLIDEPVSVESVRAILEGRQGESEELPLLLYRLGKALLRDGQMTDSDWRLIRREAAKALLYRYDFVRNRNRREVLRRAFELSPAYCIITAAYDLLYLAKRALTDRR